jgi:hypothetical protein
VPGQIDVRAHLAAHGSVDLLGAALAIKTGADFAIGPKRSSATIVMSHAAGDNIAPARTWLSISDSRARGRRGTYDWQLATDNWQLTTDNWQRTIPPHLIICSSRE